jgi:hypothetical protein
VILAVAQEGGYRIHHLFTIRWESEG